MTLSDIVFLASALWVLILSGLSLASAVQGRWNSARRSALLLALFVGCYSVVLTSVALALPRRFYTPGERECFDDWCVAALTVGAADASAGSPCRLDPESSTWMAAVEVSSVAKGVRQRALEIRVRLEDQQGKVYDPCGAPQGVQAGPRKSLSDELVPGESFRVLLPFRLPSGAKPEGLVVHHGDFPDILVIGNDHSFLHTPALLRFATEPSR